jgi:ribosomal protein S21
MCYVEVRPSDDRRSNQDYLDIALKELKHKMKKEDILQELKRREYYMAPSEKRRYRKQESIRRNKRDEKKLEWVNKSTKS